MSDRQFSEIGERLALVRARFGGHDQKTFASRNGFNPTQWNNWELGVRRIPVDDAMKLVTIYGLSLDFIYMGRRDALSESASKVL